MLEVLCQGYKVAELQVKALPKIGIGLEPKALDEQCGALIAMEGGRILNRSPLAFLEDGLCTKQNLKFTPQSLHQNLYSGSYATKKNYIYEKLKELCDEEPVPKSQVEALIKLNHTRMPVLEGSTPSKDYLWRALGFWSISLVQLHVAVKTDPSKTQLDVQGMTTVTHRDLPIEVTPYMLLGAIYRTIIQHTFSTVLSELRELAQKPPPSTLLKTGRTSVPEERLNPQLGDAAASSSRQPAIVTELDDDGSDNEAPNTSERSRRKRQVVGMSDGGGGGADEQVVGAIMDGGDGASTPALKKQKAKTRIGKQFKAQACALVKRYDEGQLTAEQGMRAMKALLDKYD